MGYSWQLSAIQFLNALRTTKDRHTVMRVSSESLERTRSHNTKINKCACCALQTAPSHASAQKPKQTKRSKTTTKTRPKHIRLSLLNGILSICQTLAMPNAFACTCVPLLHPSTPLISCVCVYIFIDFYKVIVALKYNIQFHMLGSSRPVRCETNYHKYCPVLIIMWPSVVCLFCCVAIARQRHCDCGFRFNDTERQIIY